MYVIRNTKTNSYIRMSSSSDGIPKETKTISSAKVWTDLNHTKHYFSLFSENKDWVIEEMVVTTKPITE